MLTYSLKLNSLSDTEAIARIIAVTIVPNFVIALNGDLGAGKTTVVRHVLQALGVTGSVKSPTFTLVEPYYVDGLNIYHFDLYRFNDPDEWFASGFDEYFDYNSLCFIEWAEKARGLIPVIDWKVNISIMDETRLVEIVATSDKGNTCLKQLIKHVDKSYK
jgi:tRNA threonylcarbamoyladenosine biosynthesis protein TsaE